MADLKRSGTERGVEADRDVSFDSARLAPPGASPAADLQRRLSEWRLVALEYRLTGQPWPAWSRLAALAALSALCWSALFGMWDVLFT